ncbi:hypothetical protein BDR03DRAFT_1019659 [Suillus americanus]|nr:hypothetical protein BDR03DRAFT_1019659 [Suillus americanus]
MSVPKRGESEGQRQVSWIWLVEGVGDDEDEVVQDSLRVEWCKARARSMQWAEEVELLQEEHTLGTAANIEGLGAYAYRQAQLRDDLANCFENKWAAHLPLTTACTSENSHIPYFALKQTCSHFTTLLKVDLLV